MQKFNTDQNNSKLGFAGKLAKTFINSKLTVVGIFASILIGIIAVDLTPKEEEPQISVPMIDIITRLPGAEPQEIERKVTEPIERAMWGLDGVEYIYSASSPHTSLVTIRFKVGESIEPSLVKIHHRLLEIRTELPDQTSNPQVKSYSIDDVPFLILTFSSSEKNHFDLRNLVTPLARELSHTPDINRTEVLGGQRRSIRVILSPIKLAENGVATLEVENALKQSDALFPSGKNWNSEKVLSIEVGGRLQNKEDIENIAVAQKGGRVVKIKDIASVVDGAEELTHASFLVEKSNNANKAIEKNESATTKNVENAVSIVFSKRKGTNVVTLAEKILEHAEKFKRVLPQDIKLNILRNYGATAHEKSKELIEHLILATLSVSVLIALAMGVRAALVVAIAIPVTLALTMAIYYFMGYSLNRVTLFALIFSIGILVDDAIVVVENIERHIKSSKTNLVESILNAVNEVGNPTILATFTVIASILPMAFVRGLMGPYMKPIPVGASLAMILSLFVAFIVTPWAAVRILKIAQAHQENETRLDIYYKKLIETLLEKKTKSLFFGIFTILLLLASMVLVYSKQVKVKMLPFDNKNEFQVLIDFPASTPLEKNILWSKELAQTLIKNPEVEKVQVFTGEPAPFSFSGMVKHTYLRHDEYLADLQIKLTEKENRKKSSHEIISELRQVIDAFSKEKNAISKILEIPPGPPVMATMVAEIYGPNEKSRNTTAYEIRSIFETEKSFVDIDLSSRKGRDRLIYNVDPKKTGDLGAKTVFIAKTANFIFSENMISTLANSSHPEEIPIYLALDSSIRSGNTPFQNQNLLSSESGKIPIEKTLAEPKIVPSETLYRKNLTPVVYVTSELTGAEEAPVYGMLKIGPKIPFPTQTAETPWSTEKPIIKWDGEWFITYEVFRDLGGAFAIVMILIYILVLGWFKSYTIPLIIMAPIPISLIGIFPGHWFFGAYFTATSMIGFIAGAGIIVRNSIILVDFIEQQLKSGFTLKDAVISAGVLRFRPMLMTAAAVVVGSSVMLLDPIFQGLAISLMFGEIAATLLSRMAVPLLYYWIIGRSRKFN